MAFLSDPSDEPGSPALLDELQLGESAKPRRSSSFGSKAAEQVRRDERWLRQPLSPPPSETSPVCSRDFTGSTSRA